MGFDQVKPGGKYKFIGESFLVVKGTVLKVDGEGDNIITGVSSKTIRCSVPNRGAYYVNPADLEEV